MIFKKKRRMVDVRDLQRRGVVNLPKDEIKIPKTSEGFVNFVPNQKKLGQESSTPPKQNSDFFGFMDNQTSENKNQFSTSADGYNKREVDVKIIDLDNKIYKLEQRVELLEKKLDVNQQSSNVGQMGW